MCCQHLFRWLGWEILLCDSEVLLLIQAAEMDPGCVTSWVLADPPTPPSSFRVLHLSITQPSTPDSLCSFSPAINMKMPILQLTIPPSYEWRSGKQQEMAESVDCVVWLKTACWSSLLWCFEKRWRHGWLKTAAGTYFAPRALCWYSQRWFIN